MTILGKNTINGIFGKKIIDNMKIYVLGYKGMLGRYVSKYLNDHFDVINLSREDIDASKIREDELHAKFHNLGLKKDDVIINCIGTIKPMVDSLGDLNAVQVNSVFPRILSNVCEKMRLKLIHPTTDCVYSGFKGKYNEEDNYDVHDVYGMSKALGEPKNCTVIRTSIIGEEVGQKRSLVEWVKSSYGKTVMGFTNHFWNGVTCLQFAKICEKIIKTNNFWIGTKHIHSNTLSKKELVETISKVYDLKITVTPKETEVGCDRSLSTINKEVLDSFNVPSLEEQIIEMVKFSEKLYS